MELDKISEFLDSYKGRDRVLRLLCYSTKCAAGLVRSPDRATKLDNFSSTISSARAALRLLDDVPMMAYVLDYGLGKQEKDKYIRTANVLGNLVDLVFYPIDHIAWAIDHGVIASKDERWSTASTICWAISLYLSLAKAVRGLRLITEHKTRLPTSDPNFRENLSRMSQEQKGLLLNALRSTADLIYAIHYLPPGVLWSGSLKKWHVGALGTFSSVLGLYQALS